MGDNLSNSSLPNSNASPRAAASAATMSSSNSSKPHQSETTQLLKSPESKAPIQENSDPQPDTKTTEIQENPAENEIQSGEDLGGSTRDGDDEREEEEEEGECGFCLFMKGGGCRETFIEWEKCVEEGEKNNEDIVEKCFQATAALKKCMEAHSDYYAPILQAEKAAEAEAAKQLEEEKQRLNEQGGGGEESGKKEKEETLGASDSEQS